MDGADPRLTHVNEAGRSELTTVRPYPLPPLRGSGRARRDDHELITPRFVFRVLWQWLYVLVPTSLICAAAAGTLVIATFTPVYRASAQLQIVSRAPFIAYESREPTEKSGEFVETQVELLQSDLVLEPVLAQSEIASLPDFYKAENPVQWLSDRIRVSQVGRSEIYQVSFEGLDPSSAALVVNGVIDSYFEIRRKDDEVRTQRVRELLDQIKHDYTAKKQSLVQQMKDIVGSDPYSSTPLGSDHKHDPLEFLQEKLIDAEIKRKELEVNIKILETEIATKADAVPVDQADVERGVNQSDEITQIRAQLATKRTNLHKTELASALGKKDPSFKRLEREVRELEGQVERMAKTLRPQFSQQLKEMVSLERSDALRKYQVDLDHQATMVQEMRMQYDNKYAEITKSNKSVELEALRSEVTHQEKALDRIEERMTALKTEMRAPGRVTLLSSAVPPRKPVERIPLRNLVLAVVTCGALPFALALTWEISVRRIRDVEQLNHTSALSVVGEVAKRPWRSQIGDRRPRRISLFEESIDSLRVCLWLPEDHKDVHVLAVCSAIHGEGKTSIASQLAVSTARSGNEAVLLIDADMRSPDVHEIFKIPRDPGLAALLSDQCTLEEAIVTGWSNKVHLLPAGKLSKSPHKLLGGDAFPNLLAKLRDRYRIIIVDTPPILSASESLLLAKLSDGVLVCTRRNYSREHQFRLAYERLLSAGARPLGAVFNAVPSRRYAQTYGAYDYPSRFDSNC